MLQLSTIKPCAKVRGQCRTRQCLELGTTVTHGHFDGGLWVIPNQHFQSTLLGGGRGSQKEYAVYARENDDNHGRPLKEQVDLPCRRIF